MSEKPAVYRKLPGRAAGVIGVTQLWAADDHLIAVTSLFGFEQYRRYFFGNIEALVAVRTRRRLVWNLVLGSLLLIVLAIGFWAHSLTSGGARVSDSGAVIAMGIVATPLFIALVANTLLGPTCAFWVQTAGGLEELGAPVRLGAARRIIDRVAPEIARIQSSDRFEKA